MNYYNEHDPFAAAWLRELISEGLIPAGTVDERDIQEVQADELRGYTQCHFFAGIGGWSRALQLAGWGADRPVWTGSCPCQPFSVAGKGAGFGDKRHLWPEFRRLIAECRPAVVFGEQVASRAGRHWLSGVRADLEALGYAVGAADLCAAGVGAPHIRQRLFWGGVVPDADGGEPGIGDVQRGGFDGLQPTGGGAVRAGGGGGGSVWLADGDEHGRQGEPERNGVAVECRIEAPRGDDADRRCGDGGLADGDGAGCGERGGSVPVEQAHGAVERAGAGGAEPLADSGSVSAGRGSGSGEAESGRAFGAVAGRGDDVPGGGFWDGRRIILCRDGKARAVPAEPALFPLADGVSNRVGTLRGAGNAIVPQVAAVFVRAMADALKEGDDDGDE